MGPLVLRLFIGLAFLFLLGMRFPLVTMLAFLPFVLLLVAHPLITALLFMQVSREARALREMTPAHTRLSFVLMSGMGITLLGGLLLNLSVVLSFLPFVWQFAPFLPAMGAAVIVAIYTLFQSRKSAQQRPKDASPSGGAFSRERGYYPVDRDQEEKLQETCDVSCLTLRAARPAPRFEPREQQGSEAGQQHIHLHLNLHLTLGARRARRLWQPTAARVTTIFAAFIGALSMALLSPSCQPPPSLSSDLTSPWLAISWSLAP